MTMTPFPPAAPFSPSKPTVAPPWQIAIAVVATAYDLLGVPVALEFLPLGVAGAVPAAVSISRSRRAGRSPSITWFRASVASAIGLTVAGLAFGLLLMLMF